MVEAKEKRETSEQIPKIIRPMKPVKVETLPKNESDWISEIKWDGARAIVYTNRNLQQFQIQSSSGRNVSQQFPEFFKGFSTLAKRHSLIIDGELIFKDGKSGTRKKVISRLNSSPPIGDLELNPMRCSFIALDILYVDGADLKSTPLAKRKKILERVLTSKFQDKYGEIGVTAYWETNHQKVIDFTKTQGFEGIVLKRKDSTYHQGQSNRWLKIKF